MFENFDKILVIGIIAVLLLGPKRLPVYAQKLAQFIKMLRGMADTAKSRMREEMGPDFDDVDWQKLDPRQYDPRRIIRDALLTDATTNDRADATPTVKPQSVRATPPVVTLAAGESAPYDAEAT
ncbi:twin-arginine translocase TatA/TatE family subunit [Curtobacterium sp. Leaf261]|uniref:twin-arginine translocase TatA/TatE family subunit n=1 Tax=Curtobacterium sp. Leaf261 TaxID=1736311 RepID=UPI0006FCAC7A|nr:twin-arginine translocase TatA/TatE family subunit [Curtobacterium sp. Leaf261]KQO62897.1 translocase [Curtobacterium sp. Leaf261]